MTHVVVDGSNIATEGRSAPSLRQLDEAVRAYMEEYPDDSVTVVVDATFGHRIDPSEVPAFDEAVENNEIVSPPAGAIGRGDAFVLQIADKAGARVLSNDSFQEFHGQYPWLFDEGRLMGGKPVPHVGWVFVLRAPVRGPASRRSVRDARKKQPPPLPSVPPTPPPGKARRRGRDGAAPATPAPTAAATAAAGGPSDGGGRSAAPAKSGKQPVPLNDALAFIEFIPTHPIGTRVSGTVDTFSSHGAYVRVGSLTCYVPLRYLADPPPRSAREVLRVGEERTFVVVAFDATRRGIDLALPGATPPGVVELPAATPAAATPELAPAGAGAAASPSEAKPADGQRSRRRRGASAAAAEAEAAAAAAPAATAADAEPAEPAKRTRKPAAPEAAGAEAPAAPAPAKRARKAAAAAEAPAAAAKATPRKAAARKAAPAEAAPAPAKKATAKRTTKKAAKAAGAEAETPTPAAAPAKRATAKKTTKKAAAAAAAEAETPTPAAAPAPAPAKKATAKKATKKAAATKAAAAKATPAKAASKRAARKATEPG